MENPGDAVGSNGKKGKVLGYCPAPLSRSCSGRTAFQAHSGSAVVSDMPGTVNDWLFSNMRLR